MKFRYIPEGVCSRQIEFDIEKNIVKNVKFTGGCPGNLIALSRAIEGKTVEEVEKLFSDVRCGDKGTSCSMQLAIAVRKAYEEAKRKQA